MIKVAMLNEKLLRVSTSHHVAAVTNASSTIHQREAITNTTSARAWSITLALLALILLLDFSMAYKNRHRSTNLRSVTIWTLVYVSAAITFGATLGIWSTHQAQTEFFAGWLTEYSLSFDNLFVLLLIMTSLKVAKEREEIVLFAGILSSLFLRGIFIASGAALINRFEWIFYIFGGFLIYTGVKLFSESEKKWKEGAILRFMRRKGLSISLIALASIALTNLVFAFDSIPAIFGLTHNPYVIVTATIFASMGLRQLYFLIGGLMSRLRYLSEGLSIILGFIGLKLIFEAAIAEGHSHLWRVKVPNISLGVSLTFVVLVLIGTAALSIFKSSRS